MKKGDTIRKFSSKRGWRLYTEIEQFGKEKKISEKEIEKLLLNKTIERIEDERNLVIVTTGFHYKVK